MKVEDLKIKQDNNKYIIDVRGDLLRTPGGFVIESATPTLMERIIADFEGQGELFIQNGVIMKPRVLSAYLLASTKRDFMDDGNNLSDELPEWLSSDPIFQPTAGHPLVEIYQIEAQSKIASFLQEHDLKIQPWDYYDDEDQIKLIDVIQDAISNFTPSQLSALINLSCPCGGHFVNSTIYLLDLCDEREWATVIFSRTPDVCRIVGEVPTGSFFSLRDDSPEEERQTVIAALINGYEDDCLLVRRYLEATKNDEK